MRWDLVAEAICVLALILAVPLFMHLDAKRYRNRQQREDDKFIADMLKRRDNS